MACSDSALAVARGAASQRNKKREARGLISFDTLVMSNDSIFGNVYVCPVSIVNVTLSCGLAFWSSFPCFVVHCRGTDHSCGRCCGYGSIGENPHPTVHKLWIQIQYLRKVQIRVMTFQSTFFATFLCECP